MFVIFLLLVVGVGALSIDQLTSFRNVSAQIGGHWFQNSRTLGDLNSYVSDYRTAEGDFLVASSHAGLRAADEQITMFDKTVTVSQAHYDRTEHDNPECELYSQFIAQWNTYREPARRLIIPVKTGDVAGATRLYRMDSRHAFDSADDTLGVMTGHSVAGTTAETERKT